MSMVSSHTLLSRAPPLSKISRAPMQMQPGKQAAAAVALPYLQRKQPRAPLLVCHAESNKHTYNIQPFALVHPKFPPTSHENWKITEEADRINLWISVEKTTTKDKLEVATEDDVLLIKYKGEGKDDDNNPASLLDVRLLIPPGYDKKKVAAELAVGTLVVTIIKPQHKPNKIDIGDKPFTPPLANN